MIITLYIMFRVSCFVFILFYYDKQYLFFLYAKSLPRIGEIIVKCKGLHESKVVIWVQSMIIEPNPCF